ncbi:MAG: hypothetical protein H7337_13330 [Rhizobacter sp.]|nr:hypothetical protein [Rhizobacter sp.]
MRAFRSCQFALACVLAIGTAGASQVQSLTDLRNDQATPGDVLTYGMG